MNRRLKALAVALLLSLFSLFVLYRSYYLPHYADALACDANEIRYLLDDDKFGSHDALVKNIGPKTLLLQGSSELSSQMGDPQHPRNYMNYSDYNFMLVGAGYYQSIIHAGILGSIAHEIPNKKAALILSCQWFSAEGTLPEMFASRVSTEQVYRMIHNPAIKKETKVAILDRCIELSRTSDSLKKRFSSYKHIVSGNTLPFEYTTSKLIDQSAKMSRQIRFVNRYEALLQQAPTLSFPKYEGKDWTAGLMLAEKAGQAGVSNNPFYIQDEYYDEYIKEKVEKFKNADKDLRYDVSPEYGDLELYLKVAQDCGIEVALLMIPPQGFWADYTGLSQDMLRIYEAKVHDIAERYQAKVYDFSDKSHEPYFFKDIMHIGWKGWIYVQRALADFAIQ